MERVEVGMAMKRMKNDKAVGPGNNLVEVWRALGRERVDILWGLMRKIEDQEVLPEEWQESIMVPIFKKKGNLQDCANYHGLKILSQTIKIWERIMDAKLRQ